MTPDDPYISRRGVDAEIAERCDPVVWGSGSGPLTSEELSQYESDGFLIKERLFTAAEVRSMSEELDRLAEARAGQRSEEMIAEPDSGAIRSIFRVHETSPLLKKVANDPRMVDIAKQVLGGEVHIHQSRINFKPAFDGQPFDWHSDFETWHVEDGMPRMRALSASLLLTDNVTVNGPLMLIRGSHRHYVRCPGRTPDEHYKESLQEQEYGTPPNGLLAKLVERGELVQALGPAGSVIFFDSNTMHCSTGNLSPFPRHNVFVVYNSMDNQLQAPFSGKPARPDFLAARESVTPAGKS